MFSKDTKPRYEPYESGQTGAGERHSEATKSVPSIISPDLKIQGNLESRGDIQIDGMVDGDIVCRSLTVGESADVIGTVQSERIRVCGKVKGELRAESIVLAKSADVVGDVVHKQLEIEAGAKFEGGVRRLEPKPAQAAQPTQTRAAPPTQPKPAQPAKTEVAKTEAAKTEAKTEAKPAANGASGSGSASSPIAKKPASPAQITA